MKDRKYKQRNYVFTSWIGVCGISLSCSHSELPEELAWPALNTQLQKDFFVSLATENLRITSFRKGLWSHMAPTLSLQTGPASKLDPKHQAAAPAWVGAVSSHRVY